MYYANLIDRVKRMTTVTVSPKYQVVIPQKIREMAGIKPGQKLHALYVGGRIELIPEVDIRSLRGSLSGVAEEFKRDERDRV